MVGSSDIGGAPRSLGGYRPSSTVSWFPPPATSNGACSFPALRSPARFSERFMRRSQLEVLSIRCGHQHLPHTIQPLPPSSSCISSVSGLADCERFYQTPLPPIIARGITKQLGSFAPWELPQFIATANPSATFSPSFLFPV